MTTARVFRLSDHEKLHKVIGRLIDSALNSERVEKADAEKMLKVLQDHIDSMDDEQARGVLNGSGEEPEV
jgi:hypothetical protein